MYRILASTTSFDKRNLLLANVMSFQTFITAYSQKKDWPGYPYWSYALKCVSTFAATFRNLYVCYVFPFTYST